MAGIWQANSQFTKGQLDPTLVGRTDLAAYYQGVSIGENVRCLPQGGLKKRGGFQYVDNSNLNPRLERFAFNVEQEYLFVFTTNRLEIYRDGVKLDPIDGGVNDFILTNYNTPAEIQGFDFIQQGDTAIITEPDNLVTTIQRITDNNWVLGFANLVNIPQFDFNDASSPAPTTEIQRLTFPVGPGYSDGDTFKASLEGILTDEITYNAGDFLDTAQQLESELQTLPNTAGTGITVSVFADPTVLEIQFAGASAKPWRLLATQSVSASGDPTNNTTTTTRIQTGVARTEDVWSGTRGWPVTCTFHEGRLYFGGSRSRPATIWGSRVGEPFNFDKGKGRDDEGVEATLATDQVNAITSIISNRTLQVFTSGAEFYIPESPITPSNISAQPQTNLGSKRVRPVVLEGTTIFIQRTGRAVYQFQFVDEFQANESRSLAVLAPNLINDPTQMAVQRGTSEDDANYMYLVGSDGNLTVFNSNVNEEVQGFTNYTTAGKFLSAAVVSNDLYCAIERTQLGGAGIYLERLVEGTNTDVNKQDTNVTAGTYNGAFWLANEPVKLKLDNAVQPDQNASGGDVILPRDADTLEVGLEYNAVIETMPLNQNLNDGPNVSQKKRIMRVGVEMFESNSVIVNGERIADKTISVNQFNSPEPKTGLFRRFIHGWSLTAKVKITQEEPFDMTILALNVEVKV